MKNSRIAFWGTSHISVVILEEMTAQGILPSLIITAPPKPKGRGLELAPSEVKIWADLHKVPTLEPLEIKSEEFKEKLGTDWDLFIVVSYGKIIPRAVLEIPQHGTLNVHPSLLPKFRGSSPIQSSILEDVPVGKVHEAGVTIMQIDEEVDHGPIVAVEKLIIQNWPPKASILENLLGKAGGKLLAQVIPEWIAGNIIPTEQDHSQATFTKKITKEDARISLTDDVEITYRKVQAFDVWPRTYFMDQRNGRETRVIVVDAEFKDGVFTPTRVIPEGKKEMLYSDYLRGQK